MRGAVSRDCSPRAGPAAVTASSAAAASMPILVLMRRMFPSECRGAVVTAPHTESNKTITLRSRVTVGYRTVR
ncbi:hypothetical protein Stsp01_35120 [Streptomyces sp. NBRC 13847]|nr:hypothetical protein Stsp01_35120 [Streptomyces sp. NBRC 13847]